jgi:hypothetical protein
VPVEQSAVLVDGPWTHREVTANGARFHLAECGPADGPLLLLLHGFPEFWWSWRHQLVALGDAGFRAVAPDLRGYGASDKPPRGYDAYTLSSDVAGMVRALGARDATVVGSGGVGWSPGAWPRCTLPWSAGWPSSACRTPGGCTPRCGRDPAQLRAAPTWPSSSCRGSGGAAAQGRRGLRRPAAAALGRPGLPRRETEARCRAAMQIPGARTARWSGTAGRCAR